MAISIRRLCLFSRDAAVIVHWRFTEWLGIPATGVHTGLSCQLSIRRTAYYLKEAAASL